jgi:hypothetical protein
MAEDAMTNEQAALEAVQESTKMGWGSESPRASVERDEEDEDGEEGHAEGGILDEQARERLLGTEMGKVVGDILVKDKEKKEKDRIGTVEKTLGVPFWGSGLEVQIEESERADGFALGNDDPHPMLCLFEGAAGLAGRYLLVFTMYYILRRFLRSRSYDNALKLWCITHLTFSASYVHIPMALLTR